MKLFLEDRFQNVAIRMVAIGSEFPHIFSSDFGGNVTSMRECDHALTKPQHEVIIANDVQAVRCHVLKVSDVTDHEIVFVSRSAFLSSSLDLPLDQSVAWSIISN